MLRASKYVLPTMGRETAGEVIEVRSTIMMSVALIVALLAAILVGGCGGGGGNPPAGNWDGTYSVWQGSGKPATLLSADGQKRLTEMYDADYGWFYRGETNIGGGEWSHNGDDVLSWLRADSYAISPDCQVHAYIQGGVVYMEYHGARVYPQKVADYPGGIAVAVSTDGTKIRGTKNLFTVDAEWPTPPPADG